MRSLHDETQSLTAMVRSENPESFAKVENFLRSCDIKFEQMRLTFNEPETLIVLSSKKDKSGSSRCLFAWFDKQEIKIGHIQWFLIIRSFGSKRIPSSFRETRLRSLSTG